MDTVIRSARLAAARTRLRELTADGAGPRDKLLTERDSWRAQVEQQVRAEVMAQAENLYHAERDRGYADGHADAAAEAGAAAATELEREREELREQVASTLRAMEVAHETALRQLQSMTGEIAFAAVCRFVGDKAASPALVLHVVDCVCTQLRGTSLATVRMHPRDVEQMGCLLRDDAWAAQASRLNIVADESLQLGGCVVETIAGRYDGSLQTQLTRLHAVLTGAASAGS